MNEPDELTPEEVFIELTEKEELALKKSLEDIEPLTTSEYINLLGDLDIPDNTEK